jgi:hypothetical protein
MMSHFPARFTTTNVRKRERPIPGDGGINQEHGLGLWAIKPDGTGERLLTTGWGPDWR